MNYILRRSMWGILTFGALAFLALCVWLLLFSHVNIVKETQKTRVHVVFSGNHLLAPSFLLEKAKISQDPYLSKIKTNLEAIEQRLSQTGWFDRVGVRLLPDTLSIQLEEREPVLRLEEKDGHTLFLDSVGHKMASTTLNLSTPLPLITGKGAKDNLCDIFCDDGFLNLLPPHTTSLIRISNRRWDIVLQKTLRILLPQDNPSQALKKLITLDQKYVILSDSSVRSIDMRTPALSVVLDVAVKTS